MAQQIQKKFIQDNAVDEDKILLSNSGALRILDSQAAEQDLISLNNADQALILGEIALTAADMGIANGLATLNAQGKIPNSQVPAIAITDTFVVGSEAAMLALSGAETGDVAVRTDIQKSFILAGTDPSELSDWQELLSPTDEVQSVNGQTGTVILDSDDISEGSTNLYYTQTRFDSAFSAKSTSDLDEGANLYYTQTRFDLAFDDKDSDDLAEGTINLYYTDARVSANADVIANTAKVSADGSINTHSDVDTVTIVPITNYVLTWNGINWVPAASYTSADFDTDFNIKTTDDLFEGPTNLYYTEARFDSAFGAKSTSDLSEGVNLYFTDARAESAILAGHVATGNGATAVANTDSIGEAIEKLDGAREDHETRIVALEGGDAVPLWSKERFELTSTDITNGYIDLAQEAVENSIVAFVDRLAIHEGAAEDYTVTIPFGVSRITFLNELVDPGQQQLEAGDVINVTYQYRD